MNWEKNNGFVGVDISVAVIILLILIPTIAGMIYNVNRSNSSIKRKTQATNIAVNVMENAKCIPFEPDNSMSVSDICTKYIEDLYTEICSVYQEYDVDKDGTKVLTAENWEEDGTTYENIQTGTITLSMDSVLYQIKIGMQIGETVDNSTTSILRVRVIYKVGLEERTVNLKTSFVLKG